VTGVPGRWGSVREGVDASFYTSFKFLHVFQVSTRLSRRLRCATPHAVRLVGPSFLPSSHSGRSASRSSQHPGHQDQQESGQPPLPAWCSVVALRAPAPPRCLMIRGGRDPSSPRPHATTPGAALQCVGLTEPGLQAPDPAAIGEAAAEWSLTRQKISTARTGDTEDPGRSGPSVLLTSLLPAGHDDRTAIPGLNPAPASPWRVLGSSRRHGECPSPKTSPSLRLASSVPHTRVRGRRARRGMCLEQWM
jgi:hypothetical protein